MAADADARRIAFQGEPGAYSDLACRRAYPDFEPLPCSAFEDAFAAVESGEAALAMIPIENSIAGRVADIHRLLPETGLHIVAEHFELVRHQLLAAPGASLGTIRRVRSHVHALGQCGRLIRELGLTAFVHADTAGAAAEVAERADPEEAAIASTLAAEHYGLQILRADIEDAAHNTTRFIVLAREPADPPPGAPATTTLLFKVRNVPAALYKALGGFATNGVNMTKLESYMTDGSFTATQFYADIEGRPEDHSVRLALEELDFFSRETRILGVYPVSPVRGRLNGDGC
ncbi:MAG: prephenate dehydratase [Alphaproteobacteria bacterium]|nr:prephenate dehydratase [Alphaproteobacteria bacterium]